MTNNTTIYNVTWYLQQLAYALGDGMDTFLQNNPIFKSIFDHYGPLVPYAIVVLDKLQQNNPNFKSWFIHYGPLAPYAVYLFGKILKNSSEFERRLNYSYREFECWLNHSFIHAVEYAVVGAVICEMYLAHQQTASGDAEAAVGNAGAALQGNTCPLGNFSL